MVSVKTHLVVSCVHVVQVTLSMKLASSVLVSLLYLPTTDLPSHLPTSSHLPNYLHPLTYLPTPPTLTFLTFLTPLLTVLTFLPTHLPTYPPTYLPTHPPTYLPTQLPTRLPRFHISIVLPDHNECHLNSTCVNGKCVNLVGNYRCLCDQGYQPSRQGKACSGMINLLYDLVWPDLIWFTTYQS